MTCDGCARHVESALKGVAGVAEVTVPTWQAGRATAIVEPAVTDDTLTRSVEAAGVPRLRARATATS
jgi:copper chaperone CopZ